MHTVEILYKDNQLPRLKHVGGKDRSNWVDLYVDRVKINGEEVPWDSEGAIAYQPGQYLQLYFGVAMKLPEGMEAHIAPRGSTFKHFGILQTNSVGVVDSSFCGPDDEWFAPMYTVRNGHIMRYDRTNQFRLVPVMDDTHFAAVDTLDHPNRGGHGSSGRH